MISRFSETGLRCAEALFQEVVLRSRLTYQSLQLLSPVLEGALLSRLVVELTPAVLSLLVIQHT